MVLALEFVIRAYNNTPRRRLQGRTPAAEAGNPVAMPEFFFGQPVIYHKEPNASVTSKLEPKWKEGVFLCVSSILGK